MSLTAMNKTFRLFLKLTSFIYKEETGSFTHIDLHLGNLFYEMEKSLTVPELEEAIRILQLRLDNKKKQSIITSKGT